MDLGVCIASAIDDIGYAVLAEELGYSHLWFADSQLLWSDCYATMALAAARTSRRVRPRVQIGRFGARGLATWALAPPARPSAARRTGTTVVTPSAHRLPRSVP